MKKIFGLLIIFSIFILTSCEIDFPLLTPDKTKEPTNPTVEINSYDIIFVYNDDNKNKNSYLAAEKHRQVPLRMAQAELLHMMIR